MFQGASVCGVVVIDQCVDHGRLRREVLQPLPGSFFSAVFDGSVSLDGFAATFQGFIGKPAPFRR